jgi:hypothetical protein
MTRITSKQFRVNARDFLQSAAQAVCVPVAFEIQRALDLAINSPDVSFMINWKRVGMIAVGAFVVFIGKKWLEPQKKVQVIE